MWRRRLGAVMTDSACLRGRGDWGAAGRVAASENRRAAGTSLMGRPDGGFVIAV